MSQIRIATLQDRTSGVASVGLTGKKKKSAQSETILLAFGKILILQGGLGKTFKGLLS